jgi:hypothetical protein
MPWQPMHIATLLSMVEGAGAAGLAVCAWAVAKMLARAIDKVGSSAFFMGRVSGLRGSGGL